MRCRRSPPAAGVATPLLATAMLLVVVARLWVCTVSTNTFAPPVSVLSVEVGAAAPCGHALEVALVPSGALISLDREAPRRFATASLGVAAVPSSSCPPRVFVEDGVSVAEVVEAVDALKGAGFPAPLLSPRRPSGAAAGKRRTLNAGR